MERTGVVTLLTHRTSGSSTHYIFVMPVTLAFIQAIHATGLTFCKWNTAVSYLMKWSQSKHLQNMCTKGQRTLLCFNFLIWLNHVQNLWCCPSLFCPSFVSALLFLISHIYLPHSFKCNILQTMSHFAYVITCYYKYLHILYIFWFPHKIINN